MARKHNTKHTQRAGSYYKERLAKRGLSKAPAMQSIDDLRRIQLARKERTGQPWPTIAEIAAEEEEEAAA